MKKNFNLSSNFWKIEILVHQVYNHKLHLSTLLKLNRFILKSDIFSLSSGKKAGAKTCIIEKNWKNMLENEKFAEESLFNHSLSVIIKS